MPPLSVLWVLGGFALSLLACYIALRKPRSIFFLLALALVLGVAFGIEGIAAFLLFAAYRVTRPGPSLIEASPAATRE